MDIEYTLNDLLAESHLNLELLSGDEEALKAVVYGAHSIEIDNPARWLDPGWLMLTMGTRLRQRPAEQRELITELRTLGATALGFGVGVAFKSVPPALLEEARAQNFPVFMIPTDTQFQEISRVVFRATMSLEARSYTRLTALQHNLMRAFATADPVDSTLRRLGRYSGSVVALVGTDGTVHASTADLPYAAIANHLMDRPRLAAPMCIDGWEIYTASLQSWRGHDGVSLVVASRATPPLRAHARTMLEVAVPIFEALGHFTVARRRHDRALSKAIVDNALDREMSNIEVRLVEDSLSASGAQVEAGLHCVVIRATDSAGELLDFVEDTLAAEPMPLSGVRSRRHDELVLILSSAHAKISELRQTIGAKRFDRLRTGIGRAVFSARELPVSYRDAGIVLRYLEKEKSGATALAFDGLDLASQLLAEVPAERVSSKVRIVADLLRSSTIQFEALRAYFLTCQDVQAAAKTIFVHPNTLRYRLERFEAALGASLRDPAVIASLHYVLSLMDNGTIPGPIPSTTPEVGSHLSALPAKVS